MSTRPKRRGSLKGRGSALNLSRRHKVARSADARFQGIPNGLALRVKFIVIFAILSLFALCAWLNNWIGLPAYFLFLFALGLIRISFYLMGALGARFAPVVEGFLRVGRTTFRTESISRVSRNSYSIAIVVYLLEISLSYPEGHICHPCYSCYSCYLDRFVDLGSWYRSPLLSRLWPCPGEKARTHARFHYCGCRGSRYRFQEAWWPA